MREGTLFNGQSKHQIRKYTVKEVDDEPVKFGRGLVQDGQGTFG